LNVKKPVWFPGWLFYGFVSEKEKLKSGFKNFVMYISFLLIV